MYIINYYGQVQSISTTILDAGVHNQLLRPPGIVNIDILDESTVKINYILIAGVHNQLLWPGIVNIVILDAGIINLLRG